MSGRLTFDVHEGRAVVRKSALGHPRSLARQAAALRQGAGPGVVRLLSVEGPEHEPVALVLEAVSGSDLATRPPALHEIVGVLAGVAATVGRLHEAGVAHGNLAAEHVLSASEGPVLCGFGGATTRDPLDEVDAAWSAATAADVGDLGRLIDALTTEVAGDDPLLRHALRRISERATRPEPGDRPPAAVLAASLSDLLPADGPIPSPGALEEPRAGRRGTLVVAGTCVAVLVGVPALAGESPSAPASVGPTTSAEPGAAPSTSTSSAPSSTSREPVQIWPRCAGGCETPRLTFDGIHYLAGEPGDLAVVADAGCDGRDDAVVVRPTTGDLFVFARWPGPGEQVPARPLTSVPPPVIDLAVADGGECGHLAITGPSATVTRMDLGDLAP